MKSMKNFVCILAVIGISMLALPLGHCEQEIYLSEFDQSFCFTGEKVREGEKDVDRESVPLLKLPFSFNEHDAGIHHMLSEGTKVETPVYLVDSGVEGPVIYLVAGTHGDEIAGWYLAEHLPKVRLKRGKLYIIPRVNALGCAKENRYIYNSMDLNRAYPGKKDGDLAQQLAYAVYKDIETIQPSLVLDLHEAAYYGEHREFLGNKLIFTRLDGAEDLFFDLLSAYENKTLGHYPFNFVSPGVKGSLNQSVSENAGIPVITVETFRGFPVSHRICDQADIVWFCLKSFGMVD